MSLRDQIIAQIAHSGPISITEYMTTCLLHPTLGYYTTRDPLGVSGDFTTSPEISQMFGELIGLALAQAWLDQGAPNPFVLAELGPGRGTLMADILRATAAVPGFHSAAQVHLVEASGPLRAAQIAVVPQARHHDTIATLPDGPLYLIANEFLDALPIRQFLRDADTWRERVIGLTNGDLAFGLSGPTAMPELDPRRDNIKDGDLVEYCPALASIIAPISAQIAQNGGVAIFIDYGDWNHTGDTFQAVANHQKTAPLSDPGQADLTAHVNFAAIAAASPPALHTALIPQGVFLERLGITARAQTLAKGLRGAALDSHIAAHRRLTHPDAMGHLFKVLALYPPGGSPPPGCSP